MWNRLAPYVPKLFQRHDPSPVPEEEVDGDVSLCYQMVDEEDFGNDYDVFLSFRGPDTRYGFTDYLYESMCDAGIRIFRDDEELPPGEKISKILRAVKRSRIYIPIFSKDYASSKWCLRELAHMVECARQFAEKKILPIFYDVNPSDVKLETDLYKSALRTHEDQGCTEVKLWKEALTTVARIKGWHLKDKGQGMVIKDIIRKVSQKITPTKRNLPTNLVGIDDRIEAIKKLLHCGSSDIRFVIIYGIGGIGKTTLAKAVFNQLFPQFESHSFLSRELSPCGSSVEMQRKLVADLFSLSLHETCDFEEGNNMIRQRLPNKRVLLVFDGMDENDQFMQLAKHCTSCGPGSRIIITTRDNSVFPMTKVEGLKENISTGSTEIFLYEMKEMHFDHALQLFNKFAFNTDSTPPDFYNLSIEVVELTGRLPLALEVIGSDLHNQNKAKWTSTLKKLKKVPHQEVQQKLKISYDALEYGAKQIFLDIACFFINKKISDAMYMWEACDFFPEVEIPVLSNKSLIKIVDRDRVRMHDQLRDLGREIVRVENIGKPGERSRLGFLETALDIVRAKKGTENVVALALWRSRHNFTREDFANLPNVKFLELDGGNFVGNFEDILTELRWLCWRNCPPKLQANNFVLNYLVVLKLSGDITAEQWSGWIQIMVANKLKVLEIAGSNSLTKTPRFSEFMSLERLVLEDLLSLVKIDSSIGELKQLIYLEIKKCPNLRKLPEEIGGLTALRELILICNIRLRYLPHSIGNLRLLSRLDMVDTSIVKLPDTIKGLVDLNCLRWWRQRFRELGPEANRKFFWLAPLYLYWKIIEELHPSLLKLQHLRTLMDRSSTGLVFPEDIKEVPIEELLRTLMMRYDMLDDGEIQAFLDIICFFVDKNRTNATCICDFFLKSFVDITLTTDYVDIAVCEGISMGDQIRDSERKIVREENIERDEDDYGLFLPLVFRHNGPVKKGIKNLQGVTSVKYSHNFTSEDFVHLTNVTSLELDGHHLFGNFTDLLPELKQLCRGNCPLKFLPNNFVLNDLVVLKLSGNITIKEWSRWVKIMVPSKLKVLKLTRFKSFIQTPCFSEFMSLERLVLKDSPSLVEIDCSIGQLKRLIYLKIKCCPLLTELPQEVSCLTALRELIMEDTGLVELPDTIKGLVDLKQLVLMNCRSLNSLPDAVGELKSLTHLDLSGTAIEELPPSLWNLEVPTLLIIGSKIQTQLMRYGVLMQDIEDCLDPGRTLEPDDRFKVAVFPGRLPDYPMEILIQESRTIVAPGFHEHHFSGRCPPKISARVIFSHVHDSWIDIAAEVPLRDTGVMSSSQPILYFKNLILMLVSWLKRKWVCKWMHDFQREDEALFSLEFCNQCKSITSAIREFSPNPPCLESFDLSPQLSITVSMTSDKRCPSDQIGCRLENLEISTKFSIPNLHSPSLPLKGPCSSERFKDSVRIFNLWREKANQVHGSVSRRSFKNCMLRRLRKTHRGRLRAKRKRNLSWFCLNNFLHKPLLIISACFYAYFYSLSSFPITKLGCCNFVFEKARPLFNRPLDVKQTSRLVKEFALLAYCLEEVIDIERHLLKEVYLFFEDIYSQLFHLWRWDRRRGHHYKSFACRLLKLTNL